MKWRKELEKNRYGVKALPQVPNEELKALKQYCRELNRDVQGNFEVITPEEAAELLDHTESTGFKQRRLNLQRSSRYARDNLGRRWRVTGEAVIISDDGIVLNGQHRLVAIVMSGLPMLLYVVYGVPKEAYLAMDIGQGRTFGSVTNHKLGQHLAAANTIALSFDAGRVEYKPGYSTVQHEEFLRDHPEIEKWAEEMQHMVNANHNVMSLSRAVGLRYCFSSVDPEGARVFLTQVITGEGLKDGMPAKVLRDRLLNDRVKTGRTMPPVPFKFLAFQAFRWFRQGRTNCKRLQLPSVKRISWLPDFEKLGSSR